MNDEKKKQVEFFMRLGIVLICAGLYAWGGIEMKWLRRFLAPSIATATMFYFSRDWRAFIQLGPWFGALSLGYGAETTGLKIFKRAVFGLANGIASSGLNISDAIRGRGKSWILVGFQVALLPAAYIAFGVWNPLPGARAEELVLGVLVFLIPIMSARRKGEA